MNIHIFFYRTSRDKDDLFVNIIIRCRYIIDVKDRSIKKRKGRSNTIEKKKKRWNKQGCRIKYSIFVGINDCLTSLIYSMRIYTVNQFSRYFLIEYFYSIESTVIDLDRISYF